MRIGFILDGTMHTPPYQVELMFDESLAGATGMLIRWLQIHVQWAKPASHFINPVASVSCQ